MYIALSHRFSMHYTFDICYAYTSRWLYYKAAMLLDINNGTEPLTYIMFQEMKKRRKRLMTE